MLRLRGSDWMCLGMFWIGLDQKSISVELFGVYLALFLNQFGMVLGMSGSVVDPLWISVGLRWIHLHLF